MTSFLSNHDAMLFPSTSAECALRGYRHREASVDNERERPKVIRRTEYTIGIKSKFGSDFRRVSMRFGGEVPMMTIEVFIKQILDLHSLSGPQRENVNVVYTANDGTTLPISNQQNFEKAIEDHPKTLHLSVQNKAESLEERYGYGLPAKSVLRQKKKNLTISNPQDFRKVSSLIDTDILPPQIIRVRLCKYYSNKPLGFYIRDGMAERWTHYGPVFVESIFISRLLENGLAASTNLLHVNDEILEVNGIDVSDKTLDQVTDIMIANALSLILTVKPAPEKPPGDDPALPTPLMRRPLFAPPPYYNTLSTFSPRENFSMPVPQIPVFASGYHQTPNDYQSANYRYSTFSPYDQSRASDKFTRCSVHTASSSSGASSRDSGVAVPPSYGDYFPLNPDVARLRHPRRQRPLSVHCTTDGSYSYMPPPRNVPIQAYRLSSAYEHF